MNIFKNSFYAKISAVFLVCVLILGGALAYLTLNSSLMFVEETTQKVNLRARGRQAVVRFESNDDATNDGNLSIGWRLGDTRMDVKTDGRR